MILIGILPCRELSAVIPVLGCLTGVAAEKKMRQMKSHDYFHHAIKLFLLFGVICMSSETVASGISSEAGSPPRIPPIKITDDLEARMVREGIFVVTHSFPWPANSLLVEMENSELVLVDTPYTPSATRDLLQWITEQFGQREMTVINTGFHYDNLGGNSYLIEQGIPVYGSRLTVRLLAERGEAMREMTMKWLQAPKYKSYRAVHEALSYVAPNSLFDINEGLELEFGNERIRVYYPGPSHSPDNVVVYFPNRRVLFGGCMVIGWKRVGNTSDADLERWPLAVRDLHRFDFDIVIPGHGSRIDCGLIEHTIQLLEPSAHPIGQQPTKDCTSTTAGN